MTLQIKILPSLLAADFGNLEGAARKAEAAGADGLHLDIMDGHFVPNLSMGPDIVAMARRNVEIPLNVHLMISNPDKMADAFVQAGATGILVHAEVDCDVAGILTHLRKLGVSPGIVLNPETPARDAFEFLQIAEQVLCMTVHPGYGGQSFMAEVLPKIRVIRDRLTALGKTSDILVDGGINPDTGARCAAHGANALVAGMGLFRAADMAAELRMMREQAEEALK